jgi:hypothetical protein
MLFKSPSTICGCWYVTPGSYGKQYLPLLDLKSNTTILATTSCTRLTQTFHNPQKKEGLHEVQYTFPLYDGVTVVSFKCIVAGRTIIGVVKEKQQARADYQAAVDRGDTAGLLEQVPEASDAHTTKIGNIPANEQVVVEIEYLGELKVDAETDGSRFTIPTVIAPRYGSVPANINSSVSTHGISISVDVAVDEGSIIRGIQSPSHPIAVTMGRISTTTDEDSFDNHHASATLTLGTAVLEKDFVIVVLAKGQDTPRALLETHPTIPNQRALMTTLVPKFNLPSIQPEIVFVVDRSGSMEGKIPTLIAAMKVFLKSLPVSAKFNICSFGSSHQFMFAKSRVYDQASLQEALFGVSQFDHNFGGTQMYGAIEATVKNRLPGMPLEMLVLTDGEIWDQQKLFEYIHKACSDTPLRVFSLGIGSGASSSLVEGIARAGDGFAQFVDDNEKMDKRVVRMLKGALSPHIKDYKLEVKYARAPDSKEDDFEIIESVDTGISKLVIVEPKSPSLQKKVISLFDTSTKETPPNPAAGRYDHLPSITPPAILQAPYKLPTLYSFNRTTVYLLLGPDACPQTPISVVLRATSEHGPLELEIPVQDIGVGQTIHQLAAKKAVSELEQGQGWLSASNFKQKLKGTPSESRTNEILEREAVRLGVQFQVGGKFCSFVAVEDGVEKAAAPAQEAGDGNSTRRMSGNMQPGSLRSRVGGGGSIFVGGASNFGSVVQSYIPPGASNFFGSSFGGGGGAAPPSGSSQPRRQLASKAARRSPPDAGNATVMMNASAGFAPYGMSPSPPMQAMQQQMPAQHRASKAHANISIGGFASPASVGAAPAPSAGGGLFGASSQGPDHRDRLRSSKRSSSFVAQPITDGLQEELEFPGQAAYAEEDMLEIGDGVLTDGEMDTRIALPDPDYSTMSDADKVRLLIDLNNFDGSWSSSAQLISILGKDWEMVKGWEKEGWNEMRIITAVVIAWLEVRMNGERDVWEMVWEKAREWLGEGEGEYEAVKDLAGLFERE